MTVPLPPALDLSTLSPKAVLDYLNGRGVALPGHPRVEVLTGGVSGTVVAVRGDGRELVVKQALARLAVPGEWRADQRRTLTEARALELLHRFTPDATAELVDVDPESLVVIMTAAPSTWETWKDQLLRTNGAEPERRRAHTIAVRLGATLARWHRETRQTAAAFDDHQTFRLLRSDPFYRDLAPRHPDLGERLNALADSLDNAELCLVQGDFSPKNVLLPSPGVPDGDTCWVVDHEVAVAGDPVFDLAFLVCHLTCKSVAGGRAWLLDAARGFCASYRDHDGLPIEASSLAAHTAAIMLARVDGVSRVQYLSPPEQEIVRAAARAVLLDEHSELLDLWALTAGGPAGVGAAR